MKRSFLLFLLMPFIYLGVNSQVVHVPVDYASIQNAIDSVNTNDTIVIAPGTYFENLIVDKAITLASNYIFSGDTSIISSTIIDGDTAGTVIMVDSIIADTVRFIGFTVRNGNGTLSDPQGYNFLMKHGGGFYIKDVHAIDLERMIIRDNHILTNHNSAGGMLCQNSTIRISNSLVKDNLVRGGSFNGEGAGLYFIDATAHIDNCEISGNYSWEAYGQGGGIFALDSEVKLENSSIHNNICIDAGAIQISNSDFEIINCNIDSNQAHLYGAIRVFTTDDSEFKMSGSSINFNTASNTGGTLSFYRANALIENCEINDNKGGYNGGAIAASQSEIVITDSEINRNISSSGIGGDGAGISAHGCQIDLHSVVFDSNACLPPDEFGEGGAIKLSQSTLNMDSVVLSNNFADRGSAIFSNASDITMKYTLIYGNKAHDGGTIYSYGSNYKIISSTMANNIAVNNGGGFRLQRDTMLLLNSILWNNQPDELYFHSYQGTDTSIIDIAYSNIQGHQSNMVNTIYSHINWHSTNPDIDPQFVDTLNRDYSLSSTSPLIDAGTVSFALDTIFQVEYLAADYSGNAPDMGAFENANTVNGMDEFSESNFQVYPNPFTNRIEIASESQDIKRYELVDNTGRIIMSKNIAGKKRHLLSTDNLTSGIYYIKIISDKNVEVKKMIKEM